MEPLYKNYDCQICGRTKESRAIINRLLETGLRTLSIYEQLQDMLEVISSIPCLEAINQGAIFLVDQQGDLVMVADYHLSRYLKQRCARIKPGECLCGMVLKRRKILFRSCLDDDHTIRPEGIIPHGHYVLPLKNCERMLGVVTLYVDNDHCPGPVERELMEDVTLVLSNILARRLNETTIQVKRMEVEESRAEIVEKLGRAAEYRDVDTGLHILRIAQYAAHIGNAIGLSVEDVELLRRAAPMHDVGKIGISDDILLKPGKLSGDEFEQMKKHSVIGERILNGNSSLMSAARKIALGHHEKWDGSGYPHGLAGKDIPLFARICAVADVFDALTMKRPYKQAWPVEKAVALICDGAGGHFDPQLVAAFDKELPHILRTKTLYNEETINPSEQVHLPPVPQVEGVLFSWRDKYSIGIPVVDEHHHYLFDLINHLDTALRGRESVMLVGRALKALENYTMVHFTEEERMMAEHNYVDIDSHRQEHKKFVRQLEKFWETLKFNPLLLNNEMPQFLNDWLLNHIMLTDQRMAQHLEQNSG